MTTEEMYEKSLEKINQSTIQVEIVEQIRLVTDALITKKLGSWTGDEISRALSTLAVLRVNLGEGMADAIAKYDFSYLHRKIRYASEWKSNKTKLNKQMEKATVGDIEAETQQNILDDLVLENENKHYGERLRILYDSTGTLISALQSRLNILKKEMQETAYYKK